MATTNSKIPSNIHAHTQATYPDTQTGNVTSIMQTQHLQQASRQEVKQRGKTGQTDRQTDTYTSMLGKPLQHKTRHDRIGQSRARHANSQTDQPVTDDTHYNLQSLGEQQTTMCNQA